MYIYCITNLVNGKKYIGQTINTVESRWDQHVETRYRQKTYFSYAIREFGSESFKVETLCKCPSQDALDKAEKFFIYIYATTKPSFGYNVAKGGRGRKDGITKRGLNVAFDGSTGDFSKQLLYIVSWAGCKDVPILARTFTSLENASKYARRREEKPSLRIEENITVSRLKIIPKKDWY